MDQRSIQAFYRMFTVAPVRALVANSDFGLLAGLHDQWPTSQASFHENPIGLFAENGLTNVNSHVVLVAGYARSDLVSRYGWRRYLEVG